MLSATPLWAQTATREQDGILAELRASSSEALVSWRFLRRPPAPLDSVDATFNGRPAGTPSGYEPFPASDETALVSFAIDVGDLGRSAEIGEAEDAVLALARAMPPRTQSRIAYYDTEYHPFEPPAAAAPGHLREVAVPTDRNSDLAGALVSAIEAATRVEAARRAVVVFTDGHNAGTVSLHDVEVLARARQVNLDFVITPSMRLADLNALERLAEATNGTVLTDAGRVTAEILAFLLSGARVGFPLGAARRYVWEPHATVRVALRYGGRELGMSTAIDAPTAGPMETLSSLWSPGAAVLIACGAVAGGLIVVALGLSFRGLRRRDSRAGG